MFPPSQNGNKKLDERKKKEINKEESTKEDTDKLDEGNKEWNEEESTGKEDTEIVYEVEKEGNKGGLSTDIPFHLETKYVTVVEGTLLTGIMNDDQVHPVAVKFGDRYLWNLIQ